MSQAEATLKETCARLKELTEILKKFLELQEKNIVATQEGFTTLHRDINRKPRMDYIG